MPAPDLAHRIDHTLLAPEATAHDILQMCAEATAHEFHAVCVTPCRVATAALELASSGVAGGAVFGFPLGAATTATKRAEAMEVMRDGATEIDMVMNMGRVLDVRRDAVVDEIRPLRDALRAAVILKALMRLRSCPTTSSATRGPGRNLESLQFPIVRQSGSTPTRVAARMALFDYIAAFYNRKRGSLRSARCARRL